MDLSQNLDRFNDGDSFHARIDAGQVNLNNSFHVQTDDCSLIEPNME